MSSSSSSSPTSKTHSYRLEPKIMAAFQSKPGQVPRRILIERKKRLFAEQNINELLQNHGIDYSKYPIMCDHETQAASYLPLELFDNFDFDPRTPTEWIELGKAANNGICSIPAKALRTIGDAKRATGEFTSASVLDYDTKTGQYQVKWTDTGKIVSLPRVHIMFDTEDPFHFTARIVYAHEQRRMAEASIRYQLYISNMPSDEVQSLHTEQMNRIAQLAAVTEELRELASANSDINKDINNEYAMSMNKIIFDRALLDASNLTLRRQLQLPDGVINRICKVARITGEEAKTKVPHIGVVSDVPLHDFPRKFSDFCFHSFLTRPEAIAALEHVGSECLRVSQMQLFNTTITKCFKIDEFDQLQKSSIAQLHHQLKDNWTSVLRQSIHDHLQDVGKGWFNLQEKNREVYMFSKLKKFLNLVNFMMQDSLRFLMEHNLEKYEQFFQFVCGFNVEVKSTNDVTVTESEKRHSVREEYTSHDVKENASPNSNELNIGGIHKSIFSATLTVDDDGNICYRTLPLSFVELSLEVLETAIRQLQDIPQLETRVMPHLFLNGNETVIASVNRHEPWVEKVYQSIRHELEQATAPLQDYLDSFEEYSAILRTDVDAYVEEHIGTNTRNDQDGGDAAGPTGDEAIGYYVPADDGRPLDYVESVIQKHVDAITTIRDNIPASMWLGLATVSCDEIQRLLVSKHQQVIQKSIDTFAADTRKLCGSISTEFKRIERKLRSNVDGIEQLTAMREFLASVPALSARYHGSIDQAMRRFDLLDKFQYRFPPDLWRIRWQVFSWPKTIHVLLEAQRDQLGDQRTVFLKRMRKEQEEFAASILDAQKRASSFAHHNDIGQLDSIYKQVQEVQDMFEKLVESAREFNSNESLFEVSMTDYQSLNEASKQFEPYFLLWSTAHEWSQCSNAWFNEPFADIDPEKVQHMVHECARSAARAAKHRVIRENKELMDITHNLRDQVEQFRPNVPLIVALRNPGMRERHWETVSEKLGFELKPSPTFTLTKAVEELKLADHIEVISKVGDAAGKEYQIENALDKMEAAWEGTELEIHPYKETKTCVLSGADEVVALLDEQIVMTQAMQFSAFKKPFEERIETWDKRLRVVSEVIEEWLAVQRQWLSLQPIFASPDINKQLPAEGKRFTTVDKAWRMTMSNALNNPSVLGFCDSPSLLTKLQDCNTTLEEVQKRLSAYLDQKRASFARFYFLADDELLQILSQTQDPTAVQPFLKKCFENIDRLEFKTSADYIDHDDEDEDHDANDDDHDDSFGNDDDHKTKEMPHITAMYSAKGERVEFCEIVETQGRNVEHWLGDVEKEMKSCMRHHMLSSIENYTEVSRVDWVRKWTGQCVLNGSQFHWTREVEEAIRQEGEAGVRRYYDSWVEQLMQMVSFVRGDLTSIERLTMGALIVLDVHARDVLERLVNEKVSSVNDFAWICQMRYYLDSASGSDHPGDGKYAEDSELWVQMVQSRFPYGYEYLGNSLRLVITPLTDRCYMTLMSALQLHLGGAPAGPAGTGKTETVKDLAKAVAKQCVVFNCSDGLDYRAMGKFFKGLASSGAWACFDEFNRIDVEVLSVVAQQIMTIWAAVRAGVRSFVFEDCEIPLEPTCSVFITMNPGYAGRTELPDNLKALFRPVAMMVPDYALIAEIMLYSFGFDHAKELSCKMVATFKLSSEQLSAQDHYDYGMRAVKTVITRAGILKREEPTSDEGLLVLRALRDVNVPKFLEDDLPLFEGIISDLFPGVEKPEPDYGTLMDAIKAAAVELGYQPIPPFLAKCIQLYETTVVRHGLMLVGPTGGGKTATLRTLKLALNKLHKNSPPGDTKWQAVEADTVNPKAITMGQLYGEFDKNTHEWTDGVLANIVRQCIEDTRMETRHWVVFDGPVDAIWIENMNTVLDDNKKLCLVSGEILQLTARMNMLFEVEDLEVASPATVSRCGMVYMEPHSLGLAPLVQSWRGSLPKPLQIHLDDKLAELFDTLLQPSIKFLRHNCREGVPTVDNNLTNSLCNILESLLLGVMPDDGTDPEPEDLATIKLHLSELFTLSLAWSVGASTTMEGRIKFDEFVRTKLADIKSDTDIAPPSDGTIFDYLFDIEQCKWVKWMDTQPAFEFDPVTPFSEIIVPTNDSVRYTYFLDLLVKNKKHVLVTGNTGTGKTVNVQQFLSSMPDNLKPVNITFSAATTANQTEDMLMDKMEKRRKRVYGAPVGKRFVIFVDDLNMPAREKYFAQPPIELLRQWMDHGGWYDRHALEFLNIVDISFIGAMGPPGGGRNPVTARFLRHFNQLAHADLEASSLRLIFNTIACRTLEHRFADDIKCLGEAVVEATIEVYQTISRELLPTPSKSHYTFNLRDLSKVCQGILSASSRMVTEVPTFQRLWIHENRRVFQDRLVSDADRKWFDDVLATGLAKHFHASWDDVVPKDRRIIFGDFVDISSGADATGYAEITEPDKLAHNMDEYLRQYNEEHTEMNLVLFTDAIEHVSRITRVLNQPQGNALLLGVGGSGRQSLTRLASHIVDYQMFQVEVTKSYSVQDWRDDIKSLLLTAGLKEEPTVFLFNETQIIHESFLEDVNNLLNSGEVPSLFNAEDMDNIFMACKIDCQRKGVPATKLNTYAQFLNRVRRNLHIVLCMSPLNDVFRTRLRMFPALVNCCTIDWFSAWPAEALSSVAYRFLSSNDADEEDSKAADNKNSDIPHLESVVAMCKTIHKTVECSSQEYKEKLRRYNYVTPTSYLELLEVFKRLLAEKRIEVGGLRTKLQNGLNKLKEAAVQVAQLQVELTEKQPVLEATQKQVAEMMIEIAADKEKADATKEIVEKQEADATAKAGECKEIRDDAEHDLEKALPLLDKAVECLNELKKNDIDEVRSMKKPPSGVRLTMEAACIMLGIRPVKKADPNNVGKKIEDYWDAAQKEVLSNPKALLETLKGYDKDNIEEKIIKKITPYISREDFQVKAIEKASKACTAIAMWVHAMYNYYHVSREVEPKRQRLRDAEQVLDVVMTALKEAKAKLQMVMERIATLETNYEKAVTQKEELAKGVEMCTIKLERANKLVGGLSGEKVRWEKTLEKLAVKFDNLVGDVLVAAGTVAYMGAFTSEYRQKLVSTWIAELKKLDVPHTEDCDVISTLADPVKIREWNLAGLPSDRLSTENGIVMSKSLRWPLLIDPQGQANKFIKNMGNSQFEEGMDVVKLASKSFLRTLENAVRFGRWLLIENIHEELDPALEPLLLRQIYKVNGQPHIKIGENAVPYNDSFKLFMTTKLPNPHYSPELQVKVTLLNFTITPDGLQDQMLGTVVAKESPELEQKKNALLVQNARMSKELQEIEDQILKLLQESKGDILDDESLIDTLAASKTTSAEIQLRVAESAVVEKEIDESRKAYTSVAQRASVLYFTIADLAMVDPMYQYSLQWFELLFVQSIDNSEMSDDLTQRLSNLKNHFTESLYENVCRSLFEKHKTLFSLLLTVRIAQSHDHVDADEWRFLVAGGATSKENSNPAEDWLTQDSWNNVLALSDLPNFGNFEVDFVQSIAAYRGYFDSQSPHHEDLPAPWQHKLDQFQKLLVLRCLRPDKMQEAVQEFVTESLGPQFIESPQFDIEYSYNSSSNVTPLVFILSRGADPRAELVDFAQDMGFRDRMVSVSLGQGQGEIAERHMRHAMENGDWVLLQNCHLAVSWLPRLERLCEEMKPEEVHPNYRLWLTSMPTPKFPVSILQNGVKMTNEPPQGLRANLMRSYTGYADDFFEVNEKSNAFKKLLFGLSLFHAVLLDRRKFGPLGWNIPYEFTENDLQVCVTQLREFVDLYDEIPYEVIRFLTYDVNYGGRVTDNVDRRTIATILQDFINVQVVEDGYSFSASGKYKTQPEGAKADYLTYIRSLDLMPKPEVFGLHENAEITSARENTIKLFETLLQMLPRSGSSGGHSREDIITDMAKMLQQKTPDAFDIEAISENYPTKYSESMNTVLVQEAIRYSRLILTVKRTLVELIKALRGEMVMTDSLEQMAESLFTNTVPASWAAVAYPSLMPLAAWIDDLNKRVEFIADWVANGTPKAFWISGFFFPQAFLTGALQNYARKYVKPIDTVSFDFRVLDTPWEDIKEPPADGVYIRGLFMEGARFDTENKTILDSRAKELFTTMPVIHLVPTDTPSSDVGNTYVYKCPVYKVLTRRGTLSTTGHSTNFVQFIDLPTSQPPEKWIKAGVAMFCALRY
jgi:dynein axonemal heavy chain